MFKENRKKITVFMFMAACVTIGIAAHTPEKKQQGQWKNLKVLPQDISKDSLHNVMEFYSRSLGVHCNFCHAKSKDPNQKWPDFASDEKMEKEVARKMMTMTGEINLKYFNWMNSTQPDTIRSVTCVTCHHGTPHPENMPAPEAPHGMGGPGGTPPPPPPAPPANNK
jgi:hypothetical protein